MLEDQSSFKKRYYVKCNKYDFGSLVINGMQLTNTFFNFKFRISPRRWKFKSSIQENQLQGGV